MQYLYGNDIQGQVDFSDERLESFWQLRLAKGPAQDFACLLVGGVRDHLSAIDAALRGALENFAFERLTPVDRSILRLGAYEILFADHIPAEAAINEAVEIARRFGGEESPRFANGVLDRVKRERDAAGG